MKIVKCIALCAGMLICLAALLLCGLIIFLTITEYRPADFEEREIRFPSQTGEPAPGDARQPAPLALPRAALGVPMSLLSWNIGYAALDAGADFFMDGGKTVRPATAAAVFRNLDGITQTIAAAHCDIVLVQEVDTASHRSYYTDQASLLAAGFPGSSAFAWNFHCAFLPYPFPEFIGKVSSGLVTLNRFETSTAMRISLPNPFAWPVRTANLKRCLLLSRLPLANSQAELVIVNLHLEAYDTSGGREAQTRALLDLLYREYAQGNYCIAGGDFNQNFPGIDPVRFAIKNSERFIAGELSPALLAEGWRFAADPVTPGARLLNEPYSGDLDATQLYVIDGFIISPNVKLISAQTFDMGFAYSDHNPVKIEVRLE